MKVLTIVGVLLLAGFGLKSAAFQHFSQCGSGDLVEAFGDRTVNRAEALDLQRTLDSSTFRRQMRVERITGHRAVLFDRQGDDDARSGRFITSSQSKNDAEALRRLWLGVYVRNHPREKVAIVTVDVDYGAGRDLIISVGQCAST